ncbi:hypothetical protein ACFQJD_07055 [Haloplanus sp. GCM10025708]|uniref:hypothetical protein n=1 Tax=Haloplanus sp. GCM10025708 TaxID=3252679 RepID=UPI0036237268
MTVPVATAVLLGGCSAPFRDSSTTSTLRPASTSKPSASSTGRSANSKSSGKSTSTRARATLSPIRAAFHPNATGDAWTKTWRFLDETPREESLRGSEPPSPLTQ